jgi:signal peptidase I
MPAPKKSKKKSFSKSSGIFDWLKAFSIALLLIIASRFFFLDLASLSDSSMERSLLAGDIVVVKKWNYGVRLPMRLVPDSWIMKFTSDTVPPQRQLPYLRLPASSHPDYNQLVLLNVPAPHQLSIERRTRTIKRIAALPGDIIKIRNGDIWINDNRTVHPANVQWNYIVEFKKGSDIKGFFNEHKIGEGSKLNSRNTYILPLTRHLADSLLRKSTISYLKKQNPLKDFSNPYGEKAVKWDSDHFGPVTVPYKGYHIDLDTYNLDMYRFLLTHHENCEVKISNDSVFINNKYQSDYEFKYDYYFMLGDNRHNTSDSRYWGLVPETHVIGQVTSVFVSLDKNAGFFNKFRWKRLLTAVN